MMQCGACSEYFYSESAFSKHRTGDYGEPIYGKHRVVIGYRPGTRRCRSRDEMTSIGMTKTTKTNRELWGTGEWVGWRNNEDTSADIA